MKKRKDDKRRVGRPPEPVPQDIAEALITWLSEGKTLRSFCRQEGMPSRRTVDEWRWKDDEFATRVARARDLGFEAMAEESLAIADDGSGDVVVTADGDVQVQQDVVQRSKLRVETRLKLLACWDPRRYGAKAQVEHQGGISIVVDTGVPRRVDPG